MRLVIFGMLMMLVELVECTCSVRLVFLRLPKLSFELGETGETAEFDEVGEVRGDGGVSEHG